MASTLRAWTAGALALVGFLPTTLAGPGQETSAKFFSLDVRSATTGGAVAGAQVQLYASGSIATRSSVTDSEGRAGFPGIFPGIYRAAIRAEGFAEARADSLTLGSEASSSQTISLLPGAPLAGRVVDATGGPVAGADVCVVPAGAALLGSMPGVFRSTPLAGGPLCVSSGADGSAALPSLPYGSYRVTVKSERHATLDAELVQLTQPPVKQSWVLSPAGVLSGRLVDTSAGRGVAGAAVHLKDRLRGKTVEAVTDPEGAFRVAGLAPGIWRVEIEPAEHLALLRDTVLVEANGSTNLGTLKARPASFVAGRVTASDGTPAAAAEIRVVEADGAKRTLRSTTTDAQGGFRIGGLPRDAAVDLMVRPKQGAARAFRGLTLPVENGSFPIEASTRIRGVVSAQNGAIPPGTQVTAFPGPDHPSFEANAGLARMAPVDPSTGAFTVENVPPGGPIELRVFAPGLPTGTATVQARTAEDAEPVRIEIHRSEPAVHGEVRDRDGRPVAGARIGVTTTDADGRFTLENVEPGQTKFVVMHPDYAPLAHEFRPGAEDVSVLVLDPGGSVEGTVTDGQGRPVVGVHVSTDYLGSSAVSGVGGKFRIDHVPAGDGSVQRQGMGAGGDFERRKVTLEPGETKQASFVVGSGMIDGSVTRGGEPLSAATISVTEPLDGKRALHPAEYLYQTATSDEDGGFALAGLRPGPATMVVNFGKQSLTFPITVPEGPGSRFDLDLPRHILRGVVLDSAGRAMPNACVASGITATAPIARADVTAAAASDAEKGSTDSYTRTTTDGEGNFLLFIEEETPTAVTVCTCAAGCQDVAVDFTREDDPVTLWFAPKAQKAEAGDQD